MDVLYIVMPAYNEEETIEQVVRSWYPLLTGKSELSRLVVADSGSGDRTHEILLSLQKELPQLEILPNTLKQHGPKLIAMYRYAIAQGADYVFQTDSDGQTNPKEFEGFWKKRASYEAVIGIRRKRGDGFARKVVEKVVCMLLFFFFGVKVPDANAPFRLMHTSLLKKYMSRFSEEYNLPNIMLVTFFAYDRQNVIFKEITFGARQGGKNSMNLLKICKTGWKALADFAAFKKIMKVDR